MDCITSLQTQNLMLMAAMLPTLQQIGSMPWSAAEAEKKFLYRPISVEDLRNTRGHTWESHVDVPVLLYEHIQNVYHEICKEEAEGNIIIHRYSEIDPSEQKLHANYVRDHIDDPAFVEYREFLIRYFSMLWD